MSEKQKKKIRFVCMFLLVVYSRLSVDCFQQCVYARAIPYAYINMDNTTTVWRARSFYFFFFFSATLQLFLYLSVSVAINFVHCVFVGGVVVAGVF